LHYHPIPNGAKQKEKAGNRPKHRPGAATRFYQAASANPRPVGFTPEMFGAPAATPDAIFPAVGADEPRSTWVLGPLLPMIRQICAGRLAFWEKWEAGSNTAQGSRAQLRI
jgi:hypothetical protein